MSEPDYAAEVPVRRLARPGRMPLLARLMLHQPEKRGWASRLRRNLVKESFKLLHQRLGLPARGEVRLDGGDGERRFRADFANTAYVQVLRQERAGTFEPDVCALLALLSPQVERVWDVGANCGFVTARLLCDPSFRGRVEAFEINPPTYRDLARMVRDCGVQDRVGCHPFGLSAQDGELRLASGPHSVLARVAADGGRPVQVRAADGLDLPDPDLIKLDVEGHEDAVLAGAQARLARARPAVVLESWYREGAERAAMLAPLQRLDALGYRLYRLDGRRTAPDRVRLELHATSAEARAERPGQINLLALHPQAAEPVLARFAGA